MQLHEDDIRRVEGTVQTALPKTASSLPDPPPHFPEDRHRCLVWIKAAGLAVRRTILQQRVVAAPEPWRGMREEGRVARCSAL